MKIRILLAGLGLFALVSGALKSRPRVSERLGGLGVGPFEALMGFVLVMSQAPGLANEGLRIGLGWATLATMVVSNVQAMFKSRSVARGRRDSEGHRLYAQIKFKDAMAKAESDAENVGLPGTEPGTQPEGETTPPP